MKTISGYYDFILELHSDNVENVRLKWYADIDEKDFEEIISADPTTIIKNDEIKKMGNYSKWLLHLYKTGNLLLEDLYKATEYLTLHKNNYSTLSRINKKLLNLFNFKTLPELYEAIASFDKPKNVVDEKTLVTNRFYINTNQAAIVFENDKYMVIQPLTIESENFYGVNSKWCTLKPNFWKTYTDAGPLYIIINKKMLNSEIPRRRIQLSVAKTQYMDLNDAHVEYYVALSELKDKLEMKPIIDELIKKTGQEILSKTEVLNTYLNGTKEEIAKIIEKYNTFDDFSDDEYAKILDRLSRLNVTTQNRFTDSDIRHIDTILSQNRVIDNESYTKLFATLDTSKQLNICFINKSDIQILKPHLNNEAKQQLDTIEDLLTNEIITKKEIEKFIGSQLDVKNRQDKMYEYAMTKSRKWRMAMVLWCLDNVSDITAIKGFLIKFEDDLRFIKNVNKPNTPSKFLNNLLDSLYASEVTESVKQDKINKIKRRQIRLEILLGE